MKQLITPNYKIPYVGGLCEGFVEGTVGEATLPTPQNPVTYGVYKSASEAWEKSKGNRYTSQPPKGFYVPVFFSLGNTKHGHVALTLPDGRVASSTQGGYNPTAYIHKNLQDLINVYAQANNGCKYLGWRDYIGNKKVIEVEEMLTGQLCSIIVRVYCGRQATENEKKKWVGKITADKFVDEVKGWGSHKAAVENSKNGTQNFGSLLLSEFRPYYKPNVKATKLKKGLYEVE